MCVVFEGMYCCFPVDEFCTVYTQRHDLFEGMKYLRKYKDEVYIVKFTIKPIIVQAMTGDFLFTCTNRYAMMGMSAKLPLWVYDFNHSVSFNAWGKKNAFCNGHSCKFRIA